MEYKEQKRIALLVDYDNFNQDDYFQILFDELDEIGEVIIGRVYFSNEEGKKLSDKFRELELDPIYQLRFSKGKNAVDIRMSIEAIELLNKDYINTFCLATHDSDFTPLVKKLKESNKYIIGAGRDDVSKHFKSACDTFINVEHILSAKKGSSDNNKALDNRISTLVKHVDEIIDQNCDAEGYDYLSRLLSQLYLKDKEFNPKNYGAPNNKALPFFQRQLKNYYILKEEKTGWKVKKTDRKQTNPNINVKMKNKAIAIIENHYKQNKTGNIQKVNIELRKIKGFTLREIGHTKLTNFLKELGYTVEGHSFKK